MKAESEHPDWALKHKKSGTELQLINGRYYLYAVKSVYHKTIGRSRKMSLRILGRITEESGFIPSEKNELKKKIRSSFLDKQVMDLLEWKNKIYDQKISDMFFELGRMQSSIHEFMKPEDKSGVPF